MKHDTTTKKYVQNAASAIKDETLQSALRRIQSRLGKATALSYQNLDEGPDLRLKAHDIREKPSTTWMLC